MANQNFVAFLVLVSTVINQCLFTGSFGAGRIIGSGRIAKSYRKMLQLVTAISPFRLIHPLIATMFTPQHGLAADTVLASANSLICSRKAPSQDPGKIQKSRMRETVISFMDFLPLEPLVEKHFWMNQQHRHLACHLGTTIASTIEAAEGLDAEEDNQPMKFPLQEYLFGSLIELSETKIAGKKERASLGEKSAKHLVKKVLKKLHPSSRSPESGKTEVASTKKKFQKIAQVFPRKVYPEDSRMESEIYSSITDPKNSKTNSTGLMSEKVSPCHGTSKRWIQYELRSSDSAKKGEHWIKTDEDYFVLEL